MIRGVWWVNRKVAKYFSRFLNPDQAGPVLKLPEMCVHPSDTDFYKNRKEWLNFIKKLKGSGVQLAKAGLKSGNKVYVR
jgi:hypothetical protein